MGSPFLDQLMSTEMLSVLKPTHTRIADLPASMVRISEMPISTISPVHESTITLEYKLTRCIAILKNIITDPVISRSHLLCTILFLLN